MTHSQQRPSSTRSRLEAVIPSFADWGTYRGALANLLLFALTALGGEWIVHQLEYRIEYGRRFGAVMAATPHRYYMAPVGVVIATAAVIVLSLALFVVAANALRRRRLRQLLPSGRRNIPPRSSLESSSAWPLGAVAIVGTALALAAYQTVIYLAQENVEFASAGWGWPGLSIVLGAPHATALPLQFIIAGVGSLALRAVSSWLRRSQAQLQATETLVAQALAHPSAPLRLRPAHIHRPNSRFMRGARGLRSPPLAI